MKKLSKETLKAVEGAIGALEASLNELGAFIDGKSNKWRESDAGTAHEAWAERLEELMDALASVPKTAKEA